MASTVTIDLRQVARGLDIPLRQVQTTVELLDEGNTVPFITRYRKDQTGELDEQQVRLIQDRLSKIRLLAERKQTILRSIESQGKLSEKLTKQILAATTTKRLEDLYLPYKPKKQTLATNARNRGLAELAQEILEANPLCADLDARAKDYANTDRQVPTAADALLGAGHIIAELSSEHAELRQRLREIMQRTGVIVTARIAPEPKPLPEKTEKIPRGALAAAAAIAAPLVPPPEAVHSADTQKAAEIKDIQPVMAAHTATHEPSKDRQLACTKIEALPAPQPAHMADSATAAVSSVGAASGSETVLLPHAASPQCSAEPVAVRAASEVVSAVDAIVSLQGRPRRFRRNLSRPPQPRMICPPSLRSRLV